MGHGESLARQTFAARGQVRRGGPGEERRGAAVYEEGWDLYINPLSMSLDWDRRGTITLEIIIIVVSCSVQAGRQASSRIIAHPVQEEGFCLALRRTRKLAQTIY